MGFVKKLVQKIGKHFHWNSFCIVIIAATICIVAVSIITITAIMSNRFNDSIDRTTQQNNIQIIENVANNIDGYINEMISVSDSVAKLLEGSDSKTALQNINFFLRNDIDTIAVFDYSGKLLLKTDNRSIKDTAQIAQQDWFRYISPGSRIHRLSSPHVQRLYKGEYRWVISLSKGIVWTDNQGVSHEGIVLVDLNFNNIKNMCSKELGENGYTYILGRDNELIYHPRQQMIYAGIQQNDLPDASNFSDGNTIATENGNRYLVSVYTLKSADWRIIGTSPLNGLFSYDDELKNYIFMVVGIVVVIAVILTIVISLWIARPMQRLVHSMEKVGSGSFETVSESKGIYEVNKLSKSFNQMIKEIQRLMKQVLDEQMHLRKSEMKALHAQINPHFLYNTLDSVVWMAESGDQKNVVKMIEALAKFFRLSLSGGKDAITVGEELQHAENYLIIQKMRYSDQFSYRIEADQQMLNQKTLKIILQPILENAIIHGVGNLPYAGEILIRAYKQEETLFFEIIDNGFGIKPELLEHLLEVKFTSSSTSGIGIHNVHHRIQLMYGKEYGLQYFSELDEGTKVIVRLPGDVDQRGGQNFEKYS